MIQYLYYSALGLSRCREVGSIQRLHIISTAVMSGLPKGLLVATVSSGWFHPTVIYCLHDRDVGFTRRFISCHDVVMSGLPEGFLVARVS